MSVPVDLAAYAARIGFDGDFKPDLATLRALLVLQPASITYENIDVLLDRGIDISPAAVDDKLLTRRRGGYCYELNGLLKRVLMQTGFEVSGMAARVQWMYPPDGPPRRRSHMALRVVIDGVAYMADAGFGTCVPTAPLALEEKGPQPTQHETFRFVPKQHAMELQAQLNGEWAPVYSLSPDVFLDNDYEPLNWYASTHPQSHFKGDLKVARTTPAARHALLNARLTTRLPDGAMSRRVLTAPELKDALSDIFGLPVEAGWRDMIGEAVRRAGFL